MKIFNKNVMTALVMSGLMVGLSACQKNENTAEKGPAEKAGQQLDQATAQAGKEISKVAEQAGKSLEKAGEKLQNSVKDKDKDAQK